jgi:hypothetical protein
VFDSLDPALLARPPEPSQREDDGARDPQARDARWSRPAISREIARLPAILRHSWGILHACVDATDKTSGAILRARFGTGIADLLPVAGLLGTTVGGRSMPALQCTAIFNLLQRKVPAWSTSID